MKKSQQSALRRRAVTALVTIASALMTVTAQASYIVNATETGGDVVFEGSGSINLQSWTLSCPNCQSFSNLNPSSHLTLGDYINNREDNYDSAVLTGPTDYGPG